MAIFEAIKEVIWLHGLIEDFGNHQEHDLEIQHNQEFYLTLTTFIYMLLQLKRGLQCYAKIREQKSFSLGEAKLCIFERVFKGVFGVWVL